MRRRCCENAQCLVSKTSGPNLKIKFNVQMVKRYVRKRKQEAAASPKLLLSIARGKKTFEQVVKYPKEFPMRVISTKAGIP